MIVTIHQPNYFPYFGLFHKVNQADVFVIQDDVKFDERVSFKKGVGRIYEALNISCVPVALNSGKVWPKHGIIKYPGKITVSFLKPIGPGLNRDNFVKSLEKKIYDEIKNIS